METLVRKLEVKIFVVVILVGSAIIIAKVRKLFLRRKDEKSYFDVGDGCIGRVYG